MSPTSQVKLKSDKAPSNEPTSDSARRGAEDEREIHNSKNKETTSTINVVESLKKGIINTTKKKAPYTILLLGETGVGKSSALELIANVLHGNDIDHYDFKVLEPTNEEGGSSNQSQTRSVRIYEITSNNGIVVRVLDTPGFADPRRIPQDGPPKKSIATQVKEHTDSVTAVLVLANGTVPGVTVGTSSALSALSTIFPRHPTNNVAFVLTNVSSPLYQNFSGDTVPGALKDAPHFLLNNPVALQKKYLKVKDDPNAKQGSTDPRDGLKADEQNTLEMMAELFHWLDTLEPQPTTEIVPPRHISAWVDQMTSKKTQNSALYALLAGGTSVLSAVGMGCEFEPRNQPQSGTELVSLLRKAEEMVQEGVWRVKQILVGE